MRLLLLLFSVFFPNVVFGLDSETNSPTYKFAVVVGEPITLNGSDIIEVKTFEDCLDKCEAQSTCVMAYQVNSTDPCYLFQWNSVEAVTKNESGGVGSVGFKVYTEQPSCDLNMQFLLNGKIYPVYPNDTSQFLWRIDTAEDGWAITYLQKRQTDNLICGNFTFNRPYPDSCNSECNTTMVQLSAEPGLSAETAQETPASSWKNCLYWCYESSECFVSYYQDGQSTSCKWWANGKISVLKKTEVTAGHHMAVKIPLSDKTCKLTTDQLMKSRSYPEEDPTWSIDSSNEGWTVTPVEPDNLICGNFTAKRPYKDGCEPECLVTMVQLSAMPGPITRAANQISANSWEECLNFCYKNYSCFIPYFKDDESNKCQWWPIDEIWFLNRTNVPAGHHMAIKVPLSNRSCKLTTEELLQDQYYITSGRFNRPLARSFFKIRTTDKYYKLNMYLDVAHKYLQPMSGCEHSSVSSSIDGKHQMCTRNQPAVGISQIEAKALCKEMDGDLVPERFFGVIDGCQTGFGYRMGEALFPFTYQHPFKNWGFANWQTKNLKIWFGLERNPVSKVWKYTREDWTITDGSATETCLDPEKADAGAFYLPDTLNDKIVITWEIGEPKDLPDYNCAYMSFTYGKRFPFYRFISAPCNYTDVDGFNCGTEPQPLRGIPPYQQVADEYGINPEWKMIYDN